VKEQVTLQLYEDPSVPTGCADRRYQPDDQQGWELSRGETIPLTEQGGGRLFAVVDEVRNEVHTDDEGRRYKIAVVWTQD
jgi:hypothetical protein